MDYPGWHDRCHGHTIAAAGLPAGRWPDNPGVRRWVRVPMISMCGNQEHKKTRA
jgi:hypothetical protein